MNGLRGLRIVASVLALACAACETPVPKEAPEASKPVAREVRPAPPPEPSPPPATAPQRPSPPATAPGKAEHELARGIQSYEDGERKLAAKQLQSALDQGLESKRDQAKAHKYLAFIVCVTGREKSCRDHFRKALDADPSFALEPAEAGNPVWSAALKRVKAERARARGK